ncbi:MAG: preprotein translocase subunit YajC [Ruminococcus sp.]|nr:preprotein translocase subunit YajC [Ruminococcus sp.]MBR2315878.1 preprotein translocase subunit YajC [Clostridia bacterium]MBR3901705.1 preprotein translocase subunit YajC [Ruminococcus sp.]
MKRKLAYAFVTAVITVMSASTMAMTAFAEGEGAAASDTAAQAPTGGSMMMQLVIPLVIMFVLLYFMAIRPQKKREQEAKDMQNSLQVGDEIITSGGIVGMIFRVGDDTVVIETGGERHKLRIKKWAIAENVTATERAREAQAKAKTKLAAAGVSDDDDKKKSKKNKKSEDNEE